MVMKINPSMQLEFLHLSCWKQARALVSLVFYLLMEADLLFHVQFFSVLTSLPFLHLPHQLVPVTLLLYHHFPLIQFL